MLSTFRQNVGHGDARSDAYVIETHNLSKRYKTGIALKGLNLRIPKNTICGFLGPNGAGKSTAIRLLLGLSKASSGNGMVFGLDIERDSVAIRRRVGYLAQDPHFYDHMTARQTLRFVCSFFYSGPSSVLEKRISDSLDLVGLNDKADRPIKGFSGGERQRLGIAQAYINHPQLMILDEPAASIDPIGRRDILEVMQRLRQYTTIFYSTHLLDDVQRVSDMVVILKDGEMLAHAPIEELLAGSGEVVYELQLEGETSSAYERLSSQAWVKQVSVMRERDQERWYVSVSDEESAKMFLLPLLIQDGQPYVSAFGRKKHGLEDIFLSMVENDK
ncbi:ABC transporter ATP-binding protein [Ktedonosporobacter rubrisoli]|uniref:ABC transporter ATP-binding protein n=1 Tax=Ktedonosporobacter rubrisoli TaxID=2509675 RepID=A0A4P6JNV2_KTERU|nr:ABC transporter ATP-binding protein [Ktedonosporobacter rubrisoli]QBD76800.1 ABC transporter ATP-binding protein [Ktedonosporobacter rubrisoli]